jgi:hypothetical protein
MGILSLVKRKLKKISGAYFYYEHEKVFMQQTQLAIQSILKTLPNHALSAANHRLIEAYAKEKLGSIRYAPGLKAYAVYQGEFKEGWIPDNYFWRYVLPKANGFHKSLSDLRQFAKRILDTDDMPDLGYYMKGTWTTVDNQVLSRREAKDYFFSQHSEIIIKLNSSMRGQGFYRLTPDQFDHYNFAHSRDFVVQAPIDQAEWYSQFTQESVATLRITTVKLHGQPAHYRAAFMRFGVKGADRVTSSSRLAVGVQADGRMVRFSLNSNWELLDRHPDSGVVWEALQIPDFDFMVNKCLELHNRVGFLEIIGWDLVMDKSGKMQLMEWNTDYPGIVHSEMTTGPNFLGLGWENLWKPKT